MIPNNKPNCILVSYMSAIANIDIVRVAVPIHKDTLDNCFNKALPFENFLYLKPKYKKNGSIKIVRKTKESTKKSFDDGKRNNKSSSLEQR
jgi:hypothetical protein